MDVILGILFFLVGVIFWIFVTSLRGFIHQRRFNKPPLALALSEGLVESAKAGSKKITIREGLREIQSGKKLVLYSPNWSMEVRVTEVRYALLRDVTQEEYQADGYNSHKEMLADLMRFYSNITMDSYVTVIRWES